MSFLNAMSFARDVAAAALIASAALAAYLAVYGVGGLTSGFAAALATVAASGVATVGVYGVLALFGETPAAATPWIAMAAAVAVVAVGGYVYGVRGLWFGGLLGVGLGLGVALIWAFGARGEGWFGAAAPATAMALLALVLTVTLSATLRGVSDDPRLADASAGFWRPAEVAFTTPPDWFDCAYATAGGAAAQPGLCSFNPPEVADAPPWSAPMPSPTVADASPSRPFGEETTPEPTLAAESRRRSPAPVASATPAPPSVETPDFQAVLGVEDVAPPAPGRLSRAVAAVADARAAAIAATPDRANAPTAARTPAPMVGATSEPSPQAFRDIETGSIVSEASTLQSPREGAIELEPIVGGAERARTELVCFPMLGVLAEQLCPDRRLGLDDIEVSWRGPGGKLVAGVDQVQCFIDPDQALSATFFVDLSDDLLGAIDRSRSPGDGKIRKIDAVYSAVTRLLGAARTPGGGVSAGDLAISSYLSTGAQLRSPWASQDFGPGKTDRLFDVRSSGQTLALLQRMKSEIQALQPGATPPSFADALADALATAPRPEGAAGQPIVIAFVDAMLATRIPPDEVETLRAALSAYGAPVFIVELGSIASSETMRRIVEPTNGAAFGVRHAERLSEIFDSAFRRARSFCAVGVTAPEALFEENVLEVRLRRQMVDGCRLEQVAMLSCEGLRMEQRIEPRR